MGFAVARLAEGYGGTVRATHTAMSIERTVQGWRISDIVHGYRVSQHYIGYTKREAIRLFRAQYMLD